LTASTRPIRIIVPLTPGSGAVKGKEVREQFGSIGIATVAMKPDEFVKFVREQMGTFRKIAREANIPQQ
jgi:tripartite-type tricarboxylate transporter receptor subunit TctC